MSLWSCHQTHHHHCIAPVCLNHLVCLILRVLWLQWDQLNPWVQLNLWVLYCPLVLYCPAVL